MVNFNPNNFPETRIGKCQSMYHDQKNNEKTQVQLVMALNRNKLFKKNDYMSDTESYWCPECIKRLDNK